MSKERKKYFMVSIKLLNLKKEINHKNKIFLVEELSKKGYSVIGEKSFEEVVNAFSGLKELFFIAEKGDEIKFYKIKRKEEDEVGEKILVEGIPSSARILLIKK